ncbi:MAG: hypothetical protein LBF74_11745 [Treponema sp.]|jgi:hypothetical protein|nr:hypothetical protein [Treponema sp.]
MDRTAAKRQAEYRNRLQAQGYRRKMIWYDQAGFPIRGREAGGSARPLPDKLTREELDQEIERAIAGTDPAFTARLFRELAACAREIRALRDYEK